jgi:hypothetical protein
MTRHSDRDTEPAKDKASMSGNRLGFDLQHTHLQPQEATLLYAIVHATKPRHVFEVGSFQGGSARIMAQALIDAGQPPTPSTFFMIDPEPRISPIHTAAYGPTRRGIDRAVLDGGFIDCGDLVSSPVWTDQFEDGERVFWGGLRLLRRAGQQPLTR